MGACCINEENIQPATYRNFTKEEKPIEMEPVKPQVEEEEKHEHHCEEKSQPQELEKTEPCEEDLPLVAHHLEGTGSTVKAQFSVNGGGTSKEFPINLLSNGQEDWNKWYENQASKSWVEIHFHEMTKFSAIGFKSANDCPHRDPAEVKISILVKKGSKLDYEVLGT